MSPSRTQHSPASEGSPSLCHSDYVSNTHSVSKGSKLLHALRPLSLPAAQLSAQTHSL
jgi:hypothetical protein